MPQRIEMTDNPIKDIVRLTEMINSLLNFGIIHKEVDDDIGYTILLWSSQQDGLTKKIRKEMEEKEISIDSDDIIDYISDNYGISYFKDMVAECSDKELREKAALMYRHIITNYLNRDIYQKSADVIEECESWLEDD